MKNLFKYFMLVLKSQSIKMSMTVLEHNRTMETISYEEYYMGMKEYYDLLESNRIAKKEVINELKITFLKYPF